MRILRWMFISVLVLAAILVAVGFALPDKVRVERSASIKAPLATVYALVGGFRQFNKWSPWADLDPNTVYGYEGPLMGAGAKMSWTSADPNVGSGRQEILEAVPYRLVRTKLVFGGFDMDSTSVTTLEPEGEGTHVTWAYEGEFGGNLLNRYFGLMMDSMIGPDYDKGLGRLKTLAESQQAVDLGGTVVELVQLEARPIAYVSGALSGAATPEEASAVRGAAYGKVMAFLTANGLTETDAPIAITRAFDEASHDWQFDAALILPKACESPEVGEVRCGTSYAGAALKARYKGPYSQMSPFYGQLMAYKTVAGLEDGGQSWEQYVADPSNTPPSELLTDVYWPVK